MAFNPTVIISILLSLVMYGIIATLLYFLIASGYYYVTPDAEIPSWWPDSLVKVVRPPVPKRVYNVMSKAIPWPFANPIDFKPASLMTNAEFASVWNEASMFASNTSSISNVDVNVCESYCASNTNCTAFTIDSNAVTHITTCGLFKLPVSIVYGGEGVETTPVTTYIKTKPPSYKIYHSNTIIGNMTSSTPFASNCFCTNCAGVVFDYNSNTCQIYSNISSLSVTSNVVTLSRYDYYTGTASFP